MCFQYYSDGITCRFFHFFRLLLLIYSRQSLLVIQKVARICVIQSNMTRNRLFDGQWHPFRLCPAINTLTLASANGWRRRNVERNENVEPQSSLTYIHHSSQLARIENPMFWNDKLFDAFTWYYEIRWTFSFFS